MVHPLNNDLSGRVWTYYDLGVSPLRVRKSFELQKKLLLFIIEKEF